MEQYTFRIAKPSDAKQIADVHYHVRDRYSQGIFLSLGKRFLSVYYSIILNDPSEVAVCAVKPDGKIVGFSTATLSAESEAQTVRRHFIRLGIAAFGAVIRKPNLLKALWQRYRSLKDDDSPKFISSHGVRGEYWSWLPSEKDPFAAIDLTTTHDAILRELGVTDVFFEVDSFNEGVIKYQLQNKAEIVEKISLPDGRERCLMKRNVARNK